MEGFELTELIPGLPSELGLEILTRLPYASHRLASAVCREWRRLLRGPEFYGHRRKHGFTRKLACLIQSGSGAGGDRKRDAGDLALGITMFDPASSSWEKVDPIRDYPRGLPLFSQICGSEGKLIVMGGWDPASFEPVTDVFVYDFAAGQWRRGRSMPAKRSFFAIGATGDRVYVAGGHDEVKNALSSAWVYAPGRDEWVELSPMSQERDEGEGVVSAFSGEFGVVSGYRTESQGAFEGSAEFYDPGTGMWRRMDGAWGEGRCPRARVAVGKDGRLVDWGGSESVVRVGTCRVGLGNQTLLSGSEYEGGPQGLFLAETGEGQTGKMARVDVPSEYSGFVQSGCCVEI